MPGHVVVVVGYRRESRRLGQRRINFIVQDDMTGPYREISHGEAKGWIQLMVPVPPMFLVPGEFAEAAALTELKRLRKSAADTSLSRSSEERALNDAVHADVSDILDKVDDNSFRLRCVAVLGSDLRHAWQQRSIDEDLDPVVRPLYLQTQLPRSGLGGRGASRARSRTLVCPA